MQLNNFKREDFAYQTAYCEENIWHLCQQNDLQNSYVVFIFSEGDEFPMLNQRASGHPALPIFWDYHVVLLLMSESNQIFDFDTRLPFHTDVASYFSESFVNENLLSDKETPLFRIVPSEEFALSFCSDRSHMKTPTGWHAPPPNWPPIGNIGTNLADYIQTNDNQFGKLLSAEAMLRRFSAIRTNAE
ncbi:MAG: hypothetical protein ACI9T9_000366 [Oleiphilaceae bacterium]|jgi:hypothetical protein